MRIYVSGPMTGMPDHNYPMFNAVSEALRSQGHFVLNPAELDAIEDDPGSRAWEWYLRRDILAMLEHETDTVVLLPGWQGSEGAKLEVHLATALKMKTVEIDINTFKLLEV